MSFKCYKELLQPETTQTVLLRQFGADAANIHNWLHSKQLIKIISIFEENSIKLCQKQKRRRIENHDLAHVISCEIMMGRTWKRNKLKESFWVSLIFSWTINNKSFNKSLKSNKKTFILHRRWWQSKCGVVKITIRFVFFLFNMHRLN